MRKYLILMSIFTLICAVLVVGCGGQSVKTVSTSPGWASNLTPLPHETVVKVGMKQVVSDAGILVGIAKGYYKDLNIKIEPVRFNTGQEMINQLAADKLDVGATVTAAGLFNAMTRDIPMKIVADKGINVPGKGYYRLVIRKDLKDTLENFTDLKGRSIAIVGTASLDEIALVRVLQKGNLTTKDINLQVIRSFPDMLVSLANKSIDAAMLIEPFVAQGVTKGILDPWKDPVDYDPEAQTALLVFGTSMTKQPAVANRFMTAYVKSLRDYNDAFFKNIKKKEMIDLLCKYSIVKDPLLYETMYPVGLNPDGYLRIKGIAMDIDWLTANNFLKHNITVQDAVDNSYADFANKILGKYKK